MHCPFSFVRYLVPIVLLFLWGNKNLNKKEHSQSILVVVVMQMCYSFEIFETLKNLIVLAVLYRKTTLGKHAGRGNIKVSRKKKENNEVKKIQSGRRLDPGPHASQIRFEVEDRGSSLGSDPTGSA